MVYWVCLWPCNEGGNVENMLKSKQPRERGLLGIIGSILIVAGLFALLYVGGLQAYFRGLALQPPGGSSQIRQAPALQLSATPSVAPSPTPAPPLPVINYGSGPQSSPLPTPSSQWQSTVTRLILPSIKVDSPVVPVGWHVEQIGGQPVSVWDVAKYAVGHQEGSGNPGGGTNIVMSGHSTGYGGIFGDLLDMKPGDEVIVYTNEEQYLYVVEQVLLLQEADVPLDKRLQNGEYMAPTPNEQVTLISCWPDYVYDHRVIVIARPYQAEPFARPDWVEK